MGKLELLMAADGEYARRWGEFMRDEPGGRWRLTACTSADSLRSYLKGGYQADVVLVQPEFMEEARKGAPVARIAVLAGSSGEGMGLPELPRFRSLPELLAALDALHASHAGMRRISTEKAFVAAVYDPSGGLGKSVLSAELAGQSGAAGLRTLYLNLELWDASAPLISQGAVEAGQEGGLGRLLYALKAGKQDAAHQLSMIRRFSSRIRSDYLPSEAGPEERLAMSGEDARQLLDFLAGGDFYDLIVVDMDASLDEAAAAVWQSCDCLIWLSQDSSYAALKTKAVLDYASRRHEEAFLAVQPKLCFVKAGADAAHEADIDAGDTVRGGQRSPYFLSLPRMHHYHESRAAEPPYALAVRRLLEGILPGLATE